MNEAALLWRIEKESGEIEKNIVNQCMKIIQDEMRKVTDYREGKQEPLITDENKLALTSLINCYEKMRLLRVD